MWSRGFPMAHRTWRAVTINNGKFAGRELSKYLDNRLASSVDCKDSDGATLAVEAARLRFSILLALSLRYFPRVVTSVEIPSCP